MRTRPPRPVTSASDRIDRGGVPPPRIRPDRLVADRFDLVRRLGRGGMSEVWLARDLSLERWVALKLHAGETEPERFRREARWVASLSHPNVAGLYDYGEFGGRPFLVLEYLPGGTLEHRLATGGPLPDDETFGVAREIAAGLAHAHAHGIVHRDLKPSNVIFDAEGRAKLADFGIAQGRGYAGSTGGGAILGTAGYLSPEQASGENVEPASDVYSFGVILFRMLTGVLPFGAAGVDTLLARHASGVSPRVGARRPAAPAALAAVADSALATETRARPRDGAALVRVLDGQADLGAWPVAGRHLPARRAWPSGWRRRIAEAFVVAVAAAGGLATGLAVVEPGDEPASQATAERAGGATGERPVRRPATARAPRPSRARAGPAPVVPGARAAHATFQTTTPAASETVPPVTTDTAPPTTETSPPTTETSPPTTETSPPTTETTPPETTAPGTTQVTSSTVAEARRPP